MKHIKCSSGKTGWQCRLQENYKSFEEWQSYSDTYGLSERIGFGSAQEAWDANPWVEGSTNPADFRVSVITATYTDSQGRIAEHEARKAATQQQEGEK